MSAKAAVVTGGGMGLGRATAIELARLGYRVAIIGRTKSKLDETVSLIGENCIAIQADLTCSEQVAAAFAEVDAKLGRLDVLVNNAAAYLLFRIEEATDGQIDQVLDGTLKSALYCMRAAIPRLRACGGGDILNVSSESVRLPAPYLLLYAAAKAALEALTFGLRGELKGSGIRCMTFQAGTITEHSGAGGDVNPELAQAFGIAFVGGGFAAQYSSGGVSPQAMAATIGHMIAAPREASIELLYMRHS